MDKRTEADNGPGKFEAMLEERAGVCVVGARGELDLGSISRLKSKLDEAITLCERSGGVVADLTQVEFVESVTLGVLVEQRDDLRDIGKELALVIQDGGVLEEHPVGRLLHLTGQASEFLVYDSLPVAVQEMAEKG